MSSVRKITLGTPEPFTPIRYKQPSRIPLSETTGYDVSRISFECGARGCKIEMPLQFGEEVYGFGLQLKSMDHKSSKKYIRPNADPVSPSGDSHAPVPFFVTNKGYGVYVDTARYASFYCGVAKKQAREPVPNNTIITTTEELYNKCGLKEETVMVIDIPVAQGVDLYIFEGKDITETVAAYNLFSGGGCMPSLWGLGILYRCGARNHDEDVVRMADYFRDNHIPCDTLGLEPGWQSSSYSCSYVWDKERYPNYEKMIKEVTDRHFHLNLWEHAFINATSPIYEKMMPYCGDFEVWKGIAPDFAEPEAAKIFADYHEKTLVEKGIDGFKLDECDGSDYTGGWSFPNCAQFPSGMDGEQMHSMYGVLYQQAVMKALGNRRTLSEVRNSGAFASPYPFVLYSDLYDHEDFILGMVTSGFSGLLWAPEVRGNKNKKDLLRRIQSVIFSPQAVINAWNIPEAPWLKEDASDEVRELFNVRMSLVPYLYSAFYRYHTEGVPPVRAVVSDYTQDAETYDLRDEYLFGDSMLAAPMTAEQESRRVYLPAGRWYDFWTNQPYEGGWHEIKTENIPVFVRDGSLIPLAKPVEYMDRDTVFDITLKNYGQGGSAFLVEDDGETCTTEYKLIPVDEETKELQSRRYRLAGREQIG